VPAASRILQSRARRGIVDEAIPPVQRSAILSASEPEMRMREIAPTPIGLAMAAIVEEFGEIVI
jgi:hypothetical protein